jgi:DNA-binding MarR family transcriptional regulator
MCVEESSLLHSFLSVYTKFKLRFYQRIFGRFEAREASLTTVETFCIDVIGALGNPTISDFARFVDISQANASCKVQSLIKKGYVTKVRDEKDRREYRLCPTERFHQYNRINTDYVREVVARVEDRFAPEELTVFKRILRAIETELMPEIPSEPLRDA